jgi:exosome complex RNA-binding protein Csl4
MVPVSWQEMVDPETQRRERRKVAKVAAPPGAAG